MEQTVTQIFSDLCVVYREEKSAANEANSERTEHFRDERLDLKNRLFATPPVTNAEASILLQAVLEAWKGGAPKDAETAIYNTIVFLQQNA